MLKSVQSVITVDDFDSRVRSGVMALRWWKKSDKRRGAEDQVFGPSTDTIPLGFDLRHAREASGRSLAELSVETRVQPRYITALEEGNFSALPSRVFAIGFVRAYAGALGMDDQIAVERFKRENPDGVTTLQAPTGTGFQDVRRHSPRIFAIAGAVVVAVIAWNVFQRVNMITPPAPSDIAAVPETWKSADPLGDGDLLPIGGPRPAPPDQTTPALYITPGLEAQLSGIDPADPAAVAAAAAATTPVQAAFNPRGAIYGASAVSSLVVLQANKPAALVVRIGDSRVLFARQMAAGEAWRAPADVAATIDVSDPTAFDIYLNGEHGGALTTVLTSLGSLNSRAQGLARQGAAQQAAAQMAATRQAALAAQAAQAAAARVVASAPVSATPSTPAVPAANTTVP